MSKLINASSLIICAATKDNNFKILMLKRGKKGFFGNLTVFPGGATETTDLNPDFGCLMKKNKWQDKQFLAITAIRETFEESGLLLLHPYLQMERDEKVELRQTILKDPSELIRYCKKTSRTPPKLAYWSNWISPLNHPKRFDTHFFLHLLSNEQFETDLIDADGSETVSAIWLTPREVLDSFKKRGISNLNIEIQLLPPQFVSLIELEKLTLIILKKLSIKITER
jgi:8-oxo-dGTP pyrophosphatase MutT (NUDIX family)